MEDIILSGSIFSRRKRGEHKMPSCSSLWNGMDYISVAKRNECSVDKSSYETIIASQYAFILEGVDATPTIGKSNHHDFFRFFAETPFALGKRYSCYDDEWQVKNSIPISNIIGIKIPEDRLIVSNLTFQYMSPDLSINLFLEKLKKTGQFYPFIDVECGKMITEDSISQYILKRRQ